MVTNLDRDNTDIWLDSSKRPTAYAELDWINARSLLEPFMELGSPKADDKIVDVGTGTGAVAKYIARHGLSVVGVDISPAMLDQIDPATGVSTVEADARDSLPFDDNSVDLLVARMMLHDIVDPGDTIRESWRTVKPGGKMVVSELVFDVPSQGAINAVYDFESGLRQSSLIEDESLFADANDEVIGLHRRLFNIKNEPHRHLWRSGEFTRLLLESVDDADETRHARSVTPNNGLDNLLGKSGFDIELVKQPGIIEHLKAPERVKRFMGMVVTVDGDVVAGLEQAAAEALYISLGPEDREAMKLDVKISRVFSNVMLRKALN